MAGLIPEGTGSIEVWTVGVEQPPKVSIATHNITSKEKDTMCFITTLTLDVRKMAFIYVYCEYAKKMPERERCSFATASSGISIYFY
ncbi:hypothetical protein SP90_02705 [Halodesulfovibrio spirochaetisodalis]|uniref:Uncharacterized protein n=1 Tax=Halodesulfovibrio spirochaetisodalis TaxID=1560234 RepID=A0A1B7XL55_9BACT|nr:hypothetical protein SP90_02705 [Halodesulfovibrio spirochaetisodalis]